MARLIYSPLYYAERLTGSTHEEALQAEEDFNERTGLGGDDDMPGNPVTRTIDDVTHVVTQQELPDTSGALWGLILRVVLVASLLWGGLIILKGFLSGVGDDIA